MEDLDFILFHFIYLVIHLLGENFHICQNTKMGGGVLNLWQEKYDKLLNLYRFW